VLALTCKTFHAELQKHRNLQLRALAQKFIDCSPEHALQLINIDAYEYTCFSQAPAESILLWRVFLGSRLHFSIRLMRQRQGEDETGPQRLFVHVGVRRNAAGVPEAAQLVVVPHELALKSGWDYTDGENEQYDEWYATICAQVHTWLNQNYTALTTPL